MFRAKFTFELRCHIEGYWFNYTDALSPILAFDDEIKCHKAVKEAEKRLKKDDQLVFVKVVVKLNGREVESFKMFR